MCHELIRTDKPSITRHIYTLLDSPSFERDLTSEIGHMTPYERQLVAAQVIGEIKRDTAFDGTEAERDATIARLDRLIKPQPDAAEWEPVTTEAQPEARSSQNGLTRMVAGALPSVILLHDGQQGYATFERGGHRECWPLRSHGFRNWLASDNYARTGSLPSGSVIKDAIDHLEAAALNGQEIQPVIRVGGSLDCIYVDLGDPDWRCVEVTRGGYRVVPHPTDVYFIRSKDFGQLPEPQTGGSIDDLKKYVNLTPDHYKLYVAFLLTALHPEGPYPILMSTGEPGSCKSTNQRVAKALLDPTKPPKNGAAPVSLARRPKDTEDLFVMANCSHVVTADNLSFINDELSDGFCTLATGAAFKTRKYYTNFDEASIDVCRPSIINSIGNVVRRSDLGERSVVLESSKPAKVIDERDFWDSFRTDWPAILGSLFDLLAGVIRYRDTVNLRVTPRMVSYLRIGVAASTTAGWDDDFVAAYLANQAEIRATVSESEPIVEALISFMHDEGNWTGTPGELLRELDAKRLTAERRGWPGSARALKELLSRNKRVLEQEGVTWGPSVTNERKIWLQVRDLNAGTTQTPTYEQVRQVG
jgi:putative DNA primase/helicase